MKVKKSEFDEWLMENRRFYWRMWLEWCRKNGESVTFYEFLLGLEFKE